MPNTNLQIHLALGFLGLLVSLGCEPKAPKELSPSTSAGKVTLDNVKEDAAASMNTVAAYSQQEKDKLLADMKTKMELMDANIETLRQKGKDLASDAKIQWDRKMAAIDERRKLAAERIAELGDSSAKAWGDVEAGAQSAWKELTKAFQDASSEF